MSSRKRVLVIDPSLYSRMVLTDMLVTAGYSVCEAANGTQAIASYARLRPDIVMVDANVKETDGAKAIEDLRRRDPSVIAVICASSGQRGIVSQAFSAGAAGFCPKPYREKSIKDTLRSVTKQPVWS